MGGVNFCWSLGLWFKVFKMFQVFQVRQRVHFIKWYTLQVINISMWIQYLGCCQALVIECKIHSQCYTFNVKTDQIKHSIQSCILLLRKTQNWSTKQWNVSNCIFILFHNIIYYESVSHTDLKKRAGYFVQIYVSLFQLFLSGYFNAQTETVLVPHWERLRQSLSMVFLALSASCRLRFLMQ